MKLRLRSFAAVAAAFAVSAFSFAAPTFSWQQTFGGSTPDGGDFAIGAMTDAQGNVYVVANVFNGVVGSDFVDIVIRKYNAAGTLQWTQTYDRAGFDDVAQGMAVSPAGDVFVSGYTSFDPTNSETNVLALRYNTAGTQIYASNHTPATNNEAEWGYGCAIDSANNLYIAADAGDAVPNGTQPASFDAAVLKFNASGAFQWRQVVSGANTNEYDAFYEVAVAPNGDVVAAGQITDSTTLNDIDVVIARWTSAGAPVGSSVYNSALGISFDTFGDLTLDANGNAYVVGSTVNTINANNEITNRLGFIRKFGAALGTTYTNTFNPSATHVISFNRVIVDATGQAFVGGDSSATGLTADLNMLIVKYNAAGAQAGTNTFNSSFNDGDITTDMTFDLLGDVVLAGIVDKDATLPPVDRDIVLVTFDDATLGQSPPVFYNNLNDWEGANTIRLSPDASLYLAGATYITFNDADALLVRFANQTRVQPTNYSVVGGTVVPPGAPVSNLFHSENTNITIVNSRFAQLPAMEVWTTSPIATPTRIIVKVETRVTRPNYLQVIEARNFSTNSWVALNGQQVSSTDKIYQFQVPGTVANFVSGTGEMRIRVRYAPTADIRGFDGWQEIIDQVNWFVE
jgi:hypothetical protein